MTRLTPSRRYINTRICPSYEVTRPAGYFALQTHQYWQSCLQMRLFNWEIVCPQLVNDWTKCHNRTGRPRIAMQPRPGKCILLKHRVCWHAIETRSVGTGLLTSSAANWHETLGNEGKHLLEPGKRAEDEGSVKSWGLCYRLSRPFCKLLGQ
ncbi:unnamed protein product [Protopolystoma xenopodis]|uniref:Uncharacterized protein n=1 Tax=Protopolystoma xenopodis TaxID=117903 RepID=A0A448XBE0_9PLAT|nr:unnamed protein product [Protopolystoma xenopodis]